MQEIKQLRKALGLSQNELAELLQVSIGQLAMAEIGKRSVGYEANETLAALQQLVKAIPNEQDPEQSILKSDKVKQNLNKIIRANTHLLAGYITRQEKQMEQIKQKERLMALGEQQQTEALWPEGSEALDLFRILKRKADQQLAELYEEYVKLKIKIYSLQSEIELANVIKSV